MATDVGDNIVPMHLRTEPSPVNMPEGVGAPPIGQGIEGCEDVEAFFNMRGWLQAACEAKGAKMVGGGIGCGQADIDIELEGMRYNVSIKPLPR